ncbi:MAG: CRTAC1 family protein [Planctomycetia bacterium]|nr:CRTAC1 family protein [Planctomycetia bacterium]
MSNMENLPPDGEDAAVDDAVIGRALRGSLVVLVIGACVIAGVVYLRNRPKPAETKATPLAAPTVRDAPTIEPPTVKFTDVTQSAGITFRHVNGAYGSKLLPETMGGGCAFFDYDNDGDQDILFVNSMPWPDQPVAEGQPAPTAALYQNDGKGNFADATESAGLNLTCYGMGVACGDYDGDGWVDLFISAVGKNHLFRNEQGKFVDVTDAAGVGGADAIWSTASTFFDYDNDGDLDLYVANYIEWSKEIDLAQDFQLVGVGRAYGPPRAFQGTFPYLYRNQGDGTFVDVSEAAGVQVRNKATKVPLAKSLGLAPVDVDRDGWLDLIVANDTVQNLLFHNRGDGTFEEVGAEAGVAFDTAGNARGAMGIDAGAFRNDGSLGVVIGNFANEPTALYVSNGKSLNFFDDAISNGIGPPSRLSLKFGVFFFDYDLDGRLDVLEANGHIEDEINRVQESQHYEQAPQLFWNCGAAQKSEFVLLSAEKCGEDFVKPMVGRGASYADIDADGDLDVLLTSVGGAPRLLRNDQQLGHHWLRLKLRGANGNRDALGARVTLTAGGVTQERQVMPTRSYLSQVELPITFGLGKADKVESLTVTWPDGKEQKVGDVKVDQLTEIEQDAGQ